MGHCNRVFCLSACLCEQSVTISTFSPVHLINHTDCRIIFLPSTYVPCLQRLSWPIASTIHRHEEMEVQILTFNRFLANRLLGSTTFSLHRLLDESTIRDDCNQSSWN